MKKRKDYWNDIPRDVLGKFCSTMRSLGFDPKEFIDEDGYWKVTTYGEGMPKVMFQCGINRLHSRVNYENALYKDMRNMWSKHLRAGINIKNGRFFRIEEVDKLGVEYLHKYVDYDWFRVANIWDTKIPRWLSRVKGEIGIGAPFFCDLYTDWSKSRKACVARLWRKAYASNIRVNIECDYMPTEDNIAYNATKPFGLPEPSVEIGEYIEVRGHLIFGDGKVRKDKHPFRNVPLYAAFLNEDNHETFQYLVKDIPTRYKVLAESGNPHYGRFYKREFFPLPSDRTV